MPKQCSNCGEVKPLDAFGKRKANKDGLAYQCKVCHCAYSKAYYKDNPDKCKGFAEAWKKANPEKVKADNAAWHKAHPEKGYAYRLRNPLKVIAALAVREAIRVGRLAKPANCSECNATGIIHGHNCDYSKPLEVMWLCPKCHISWHNEHGYDLNGEVAA